MPESSRARPERPVCVCLSECRVTDMNGPNTEGSGHPARGEILPVGLTHMQTCDTSMKVTKPLLSGDTHTQIQRQASSEEMQSRDKAMEVITLEPALSSQSKEQGVSACVCLRLSRNSLQESPCKSKCA